MHNFPKNSFIALIYLYPAICKRLFSSNSHYITTRTVLALYLVRPLRQSHLVQALTGVGIQRPFFTLPCSGGCHPGHQQSMHLHCETTTMTPPRRLGRIRLLRSGHLARSQSHCGLGCRHCRLAADAAPPGRGLRLRRRWVMDSLVKQFTSVNKFVSGGIEQLHIIQWN